MLRDQGEAMRVLIDELKVSGQELTTAGSGLASLARNFNDAVDALEVATGDYLDNVASDPDRGSAIGVDYMMLAGVVVAGWLMGRSALAAQRRIGVGSSDDFNAHKIKSAVFFADRILPRCQSLALMVKAGSSSTMSLDVDNF
jgi:hypothetical protein